MKRKPSICAYCGETRVLTREHIWPTCFLERRPGWAKFTLSAWKIHGSDQVIRDVCRECNNDGLTKLDAYFCDLDEKYFIVTHGFDSSVVFEYDYDLLARALLKIAYNTARANGSATPELQAMAAYILGERAQPGLMAIIVELTKPIYVDRSPSGLTIPPKEVRPTAFRSARTWLGGDMAYAAGDVTTRLVAVNSYFFHIVLQAAATTDEQFDTIVSRLVERLPGSVLLQPSDKSVALKSSEQDGVTSNLPQMAAFREEYREFFERQKRRTSRK